MINYKNLKTLTGLTLAEVLVKLDEELPEDAYSPVPGGANLTDIDPNYGTEALNNVFGLSGVGWGTDFNVEDLTVIHGIQKTSGGYERPICTTTVKKMIFWYKLVDETGEELVVPIPSVGASTNDKEEYSLKGALTYALSAAMSKIGWQSSVYKGKRSHITDKQKKTVGKTEATTTAPAGKSAPAATPPAKTSAPAAAQPAAKPAGTPAPAPTASLPAVTPEAEHPAPVASADGDNPADFLVPMGSRKGSRLGDCTEKELEFFSNVKPGANTEMQKLKEKATALLQAQKAA